MSDRPDLPQISPGDHDLVGDLLRIADSGPEIPADGADRIKTIIKPEWRRQIRASRRRRWSLAAGAVAAAAVAAIALTTLDRSAPTVTQSSEPVAVVDLLAGSVEIVSGDGDSMVVTELDGQTAIEAGSVIRTNGLSRASLRLDGGQSLRLDHDSSLRLASATLAELERGAVYLDSQAAEPSSVGIATPSGIARDIGTQFEVRVDDGSLAVAVREGMVSLERADMDLEIGSGVVVTVTADGRVDRKPLSPTDPYWAWVQEIAPPFEIEGRNVAEFLGWVSRETGARIRYASSEIDAFAHETVLHGIAAGLSPTEAPEVILATCGLAADRDGDSMVVRRISSPAPKG